MSEISFPLRRHRLPNLWPIAGLCCAIFLSIGWAAFLGWLLVLTIGGLW